MTPAGAKRRGGEPGGAGLGRRRRGESSPRHRHRQTHELYLVLEGEGRMRIGSESLVLPRLSAGLVSPGGGRQIFNDGEHEVLWLRGGAPGGAADTGGRWGGARGGGRSGGAGR